ncbi:MAG: hypothetical protein R2715_03830 [Ilumatobacteraceae bacterium]
MSPNEWLANPSMRACTAASFNTRDRRRRARGSGSHCLNNHYHDPAIGMFLTVDPIVAKTGMPYLYGNGNPEHVVGREQARTGLLEQRPPRRSRGAQHGLGVPGLVWWHRWRWVRVVAVATVGLLVAMTVAYQVLVAPELTARSFSCGELVGSG